CPLRRVAARHASGAPLQSPARPSGKRTRIEGMETAAAKGGNVSRRDLLGLAALGVAGGAPRLARAAGPSGSLPWGIHVSLAPVWFDPADTQAIITPFMVLYALHDAVLKPMPGNPLAPCLAETYAAAEDGLSHDFVLRRGTMFHNGDPVTAA